MELSLTSDQYNALNVLERWYQKCSHQFIDLAGPIYTGTWDLVQLFLDQVGFDKREVMYITYDQKRALELGYNKYHAYYIYGKLYKYTRHVDFDTIPILNPRSDHIEFHWTKEVRTHIDSRYRIIVVLDASLMSENELWDLSKWGLPIILLRDPYVIPTADSYMYLRDPNILLDEPSPRYIQHAIYYIADRLIHGHKIEISAYRDSNVIRRKDLRMHNLRSSSMNITLNSETRDAINRAYRDRMYRDRNQFTNLNERVYLSSSHYQECIKNSTESNIRVYLMKGITGYLSKVNRHAAVTRYVGCDFTPDFYHEPFVGLYMDRDYLLRRDSNSRQMIPDDRVLFEYAYALTPQLSRTNHWDYVTVILDDYSEYDDKLREMMAYTAITRATKSVTLVI